MNRERWIHLRDAGVVLLITATLCVSAVLWFAGCSKAPSRELGTAQTVSNAQLRTALAGLPAPILPDVGYAVADSTALAAYYEEFRADLHRKDVVKWEGRFDCNKFATAYAAGAQMRFYRERFHSWQAGQAVAVGEAWYVPGWARGQAHAVNVALTERGLVWIEPQTGRQFTPTGAERASVSLVKF